MEYTMTLPVTIGKDLIGLLTMEVGYDASDDTSIVTLAQWKKNTVPSERQSGLFKPSCGKTYIDGLGLDTLFPLSIGTRNHLMSIKEPVALCPDEGFSARMLDEICSCLYNGAHLLIDSAHVPFPAYYRISYPMFKINKFIGFKETDITFKRIDTRFVPGPL